VKSVTIERDRQLQLQIQRQTQRHRETERQKSACAREELGVTNNRSQSYRSALFTESRFLDFGGLIHGDHTATECVDSTDSGNLETARECTEQGLRTANIHVPRTHVCGCMRLCVCVCVHVHTLDSAAARITSFSSDVALLSSTMMS
jgi:hypothetical protein